MDAKEYLLGCMPARKQVDDFVEKRGGLPIEDNNRGWTFDGELGWVLKDAVREDGLDGSHTFYHYEPTGARKRVNFPDGLCRIRTYGDSYTHCDQVSDGETWQEYLSAHLQEPVENYGVGGYGVYQAYLRMRRVESERPAEYVILNVFCDDHFRNLDAWRTIRFGRRTPCGFPLPHLRVDLDRGECIECPSATPTVEDVYKLLDPDWVYETFKDDPVLQCVLACQQPRQLSADDVPITFGLPHAVMQGNEQALECQRKHAAAALYATQKVIEMAEQFVQEQGSKLMVIVSQGGGPLKHALEGRPRWDQSFLDYLRAKDYPVVDTRDAHIEDFKSFNVDVGTYMKRFFVGHRGPAGNFFKAMALKNAVVEWLEPKPKTYLSTTSTS